jgi:cytochrome c-type biogenesis protein
MQEWINQVLQSPNFHVAILPASFLLGVLGALNPCCTAPLLGAVAGYSGSLAQRGGRRAIVSAGLFFMLGTVLALAIVGAATGFVSQLAGSSLGSYWKMFAGFVLIFFGLACLKLVPIKLPKLGSPDKTEPAGLVEAMVFGLLVGGSTTLCSAACNPTLAVTLGVATLQGQALRGAAVLTVYAIGYSLPLAAAMIGLGLGVGKLTSLVTRLAPLVQTTAGVILLVVGFILLTRI